MSLDFKKETERLKQVSSMRTNGDALADVESELEVIFGDSGKKVLLVELSKRYDVVPSDAVRRPNAFHTALYYLLGEHGSKFVMDRIIARISRSLPATPRVS
jgi:hypothetical protein